MSGRIFTKIGPALELFRLGGNMKGVYKVRLGPKEGSYDITLVGEDEVGPMSMVNNDGLPNGLSMRPNTETMQEQLKTWRGGSDVKVVRLPANVPLPPSLAIVLKDRDHFVLQPACKQTLADFQKASQDFYTQVGQTYNKEDWMESYPIYTETIKSARGKSTTPPTSP